MAAPRCVLVIDDDPSYRRLVRRFLDKQGFTPITAKSGYEGLDLVKQVVPDLILLDIHMKGLDGMTLYKAFRSHPSTKKVPVIIMTGKRIFDAVLKAAAKGVGAEPVYEKMEGLKALLKRVEVALASPPESPPPGRFLRRGLVEVDLFRREVSVAGKALPRLPATRFDLFVALLHREGKPVSQQELCRRVWPGREDLKKVPVTILRLRQDLACVAGLDIETIGDGYRLVTG